jgi:hypothetical protein
MTTAMRQIRGRWVHRQAEDQWRVALSERQHAVMCWSVSDAADIILGVSNGVGSLHSDGRTAVPESNRPGLKATDDLLAWRKHPMLRRASEGR